MNRRCALPQDGPPPATPTPPPGPSLSPAPPRIVRRGVWISLAVLVIVLSAGVVVARASTGSWLPYAIAAAPNAHRALVVGDRLSPRALRELGVAQERQIKVGPPAATLSVWLLEPIAASAMASRSSALQSEAASQSGTSRAASRDSALQRIRGTILVLHGIRDEKRSMLGMGRKLARAGYRAVLVDSRGHGQSSGDWLTYGVQESRDLVQVLDALEQEGALTAPVGVYGASYGAATAIQLAAIEPRIRAVVAVAPFAEMTTEVEHYVRELCEIPAWAISETDLAGSIRRAGELAGFDPASADVCAAIRRTHAPVLLIHGRSDRTIPFQHSEQLHAAAPDHSELLLLPGEGHGSIFFDGHEQLSRPTLQWFGRWLAL